MRKKTIDNYLEIKHVDINQLKPAEYNPRKWDDTAIKGLTDSINEFGLVGLTSLLPVFWFLVCGF